MHVPCTTSEALNSRTWTPDQEEFVCGMGHRQGMLKEHTESRVSAMRENASKRADEKKNAQMENYLEEIESNTCGRPTEH